MWAVIGDGLIDPSSRVVDLVPEFGTNGKEAVTIEQVMLHTSGFPDAPMLVTAGDTSEGRCSAFARWRLNWEPGTRFEYHPSSAHWVLVELLERVAGQDFHDVVQARVTDPAGLPRVLGLEPGTYPFAELVATGVAATPDELEATFGVRELPVTEVTPEALLAFNDPAIRRVGMPGGGGVMRAEDLARFYQAVLHNPGGMWKPEVLADAIGNVRNHLPDPLTGVRPTARWGSCRPATTGGRTSGAWAARSRRGRSATTVPAARSRGAIRRRGSPSATSRTASTSTRSASPAARPPWPASPRSARPAERRHADGAPPGCSPQSRLTSTATASSCGAAGPTTTPRSGATSR